MSAPVQASAERPELPGRLMRRAAAVASAMTVAVLTLGLIGADARIDEEVGAAMVQAGWVEHLSGLRHLPDVEAMATLEVLRLHLPLRHLDAEVRDEQGRLLMGGQPSLVEADFLDRVSDALHRVWPSRPTPPLTWQIVRPGDRHWTVRMSASPDGERREVVRDLVGLIGATLGGVALLLWLMHRQVQLTVAPIQQLLQAIARLHDDDRRTVHALPPMPLNELQVLADSLKGLAVELDRAQEDRRLLAQQVLSLQEDERVRLARELHDELGQHLTALRADLAWLGRRTAVESPNAEVLASATERAARIQSEMRELLARLRPIDPSLGGDSSGGGTEPLLVQLTQLVDAWRSPAMGRLRVDLELALGPRGAAKPADACSLVAAWPDLPQPLALVLYRISQEALTNVARHSQAGLAVLRLELTLPDREHAAEVRWSVRDDGIGIADWNGAVRRGSGLAGLRERIWAIGGELTQESLRPGQPQPGLRLGARFVLPPPALQPLQQPPALN